MWWGRRARAQVARFLYARYYVPVLGSVALLAIITASVLTLSRSGAFAALLGGRQSTVVITGPGAPTPIATPTSPTQRIAAIVMGDVHIPGLYLLPVGATARDLLEAAGGVYTTADLSRLTLTAPLTDGASVYVPRAGELPPPLLGARLDLNAASAQQLHNALGVSLTVAKRIVSYRQRIGGFTSLDQLLLVPVTQATFDRIKNLVALAA